ncbi:DegT/DnrJ/EryC1/StrS family aminotransferase [Bosea sp. (in: a-proteobacteria)]
MIPRFEPPVGLPAVLKALPGGGSGDLEAFEEAFAHAMGQRRAMAFPYGRTALLALLKCLGLEGREVVCPAYTCVVVPNAVVCSGNRPVFVDSAADANASLAAVEAATGAKTGAFVATSIFGHPVDLDRLAELQRRNPSIPVIQDCAHAFICEWQGREVHREGVAAIFGLNVSKTMTSIFGGMVTTDDEALAARLTEFRRRNITPASRAHQMKRIAYALAVVPAFWPPVFGLTDRLRRMGVLDRFTRYYSDDLIDMPADHLTGLTDFEARVGLGQVGRLHNLIVSRRRYDAFYRARISDSPALAWIERADGSSVSHSAARVADKDAVRRAAAARGIELGEVIEYSVPDMRAYAAYSKDGQSFPVAAALARSVINLPTANSFSQAKAEKVVRVMREILVDQPPVPPLPTSATVP